jgi:hypothetical protein
VRQICYDGDSDVDSHSILVSYENEITDEGEDREAEEQEEDE